ncbi:Tetratricopeptide TPR_1 repeat-containing protein [Leadbetterella byssophila DSM 17132]|uniref:Tetratricopeptide TPR_1 repeat-containing protein n=1 Tax=Leadbetterella byssophila (strain DSM 17132 / JCM 16389 / KACC 11308 / NBRC 106382 / 4M15) TaxID=649349 RepID=E4RTA6_LEAB4|nr:tetratricopeptide repeat protein [Leadbetterella byssophila]ADQ18644.1 Tetratricopeptide TPR_1 repeat-containing protein [Leadbetterella byssophila DSM 17132]
MRFLAFFMIFIWGAKAQTPASENSGAYTEGLMYFVLQDYSKALQQFNSFVVIDPNSGAGFFMKSRSELALGQLAKAEFSASEAVRIDPQNVFYLKHYAEVLKQNHKQVDKVYEKWIELRPDDEEPYLEWLEYQSASGNYAQALKIIGLAEKKWGSSERIIKAKQIILMKDNKVEAALQEGSKVQDPAFALDQAKLLIQNQKTKEAIKTLSGSLSASLPESYILLGDLYSKEGRKEEVEGLLEKALTETGLSYDAKVHLTRIVAQWSGEKAGKAAEQLIKETPEQGRAYLIAGDYNYKSGDLPKARDYYEKAVQKDKSQFEVWKALLETNFGLGDWQALEKSADQASIYFPSQGQVWLYLGLAQIMLGEDASMSFEEAQQWDSSLKEAASIGLQWAEKKKVVWSKVPSDPFSQFLYLKTGGTENRVAIAGTLSANYPSAPLFKVLLAESLMDSNKLEEAEKTLSFIKEEIAPVDYFIVKGDILHRKGLASDAKSVWEEGLKRNKANKVLQEKIKSIQ